jgi:diacylglycerol kinase family enzyme
MTADEMVEATPAGRASLANGPVAVLINRSAGTVRSVGVKAVEAVFREAIGNRLVMMASGSGKDMAQLVRDALDSGATTILPIGGDGTCTAVAEMGRRQGFVTSALPGGTKNILAKRLWGEMDLIDIAAAIRDGDVDVRKMDAGDANGRLFFVGASFGLIPHLARARERLRGRAQPSGIWAALRHVLRLGRRGLFSPRVVFTDSSGSSHRYAALMVSVKSIDETLFRAGEKDDPASFDCAASSPKGWWHMMWLAFKAVFTDVWRDDSQIDLFNLPELTVTGRSVIALALDGETIALRSPVRLTMLQDAIPMLGLKQNERPDD